MGGARPGRRDDSHRRCRPRVGEDKWSEHGGGQTLGGAGATFPVTQGIFTQGLDAGESAEIQVKIKAKRMAKKGSTFSCKLLALHRNGLYPSTDTVVAKLKVK